MRTAFSVLASGVFLACAQEQMAPRPGTSPSELFFAVTLNHHAINLSTVAPYNTIQLVATPRNALGQPYPHPSRLVYVSNDLAHVQVSASGRVTAVAPVLGAVIIATDTIGNLEHTDTAIVNVSDTATPPVLTRFSIHPIPPDSAKWAASFPGVLTARALDAQGNLIPNLTVDYESSDTSEAPIERQLGLFSAARPGHVTFYATTTAYGVTKADTLLFTFGYPINTSYVFTDSITGAFYPNEYIIGTGGSVLWFARNGGGTSGDSLDVIFDDSTHVGEDTLFNCRCGAGNIPAFADNIVNGQIVGVLAQARSFTRAGTYSYHSHFTHGTGKIFVTSDTVPPPGAMRGSAP